MISYLRGKVKYIKPISKKDNFFILDVNGQGFNVLSTATLVHKLKIDQETEVFTYMAVREDAQELFGFATWPEVEFFKLLISISGIGPKKALSILEQANIADIQKSVLADKPEMLVNVSGLTKNMAEKIVLGLQNKLKDLTIKDIKGGKDIMDDSEVVETLMALGFSGQQAKSGVSKLSDKVKDKDLRIKEALKILGNTK
ncbi:Holliday junction branch migration protein RuvA [Patescibacteria group bacterium]|nr:Holliday junction branch migration protein RuvA [Patescibacteria group bacterium]